MGRMTDPPSEDGRTARSDAASRLAALLAEFGVSPPALREAIHLLETDGLISVRRGNVGGAVVHLPSAERERWQETLAPVVEQMLSAMGDFGQEVVRTAEEANAKYPYPY